MKRWGRIFLALLLLGAAFGKGISPAVETAASAPRRVALTFDDGPWPKTTEQLLDGLRARGVQASFFLIGEQIEPMAAVVKQMAADGHQIGNHTWSHIRLDRHSLAEGLAEIERTDTLLRRLLGEGEYWLRPPWGFVSEDLRRAVDEPMIHWSIDTEDWRLLDSDAIVDKVLSLQPDGDIILLHDCYPSSVDAALRIVDALLAEGAEFVTVRELFEKSGIAAEAGVLYERADRTRK